MTSDYVDVVEAAYSMEGDSESWIARIANTAGPMIDAGLGFSAYCFAENAEHGFIPTTMPVGAGPEGWREGVLGMAASAPPDLGREAAFLGKPVTTFSALLGPEKFARIMPLLEQFCHPMGVYDLLSIRAIDPRRKGALLMAPLKKVSGVAPRTAWLWSRVAAHVASGLRLRDGLSATSEDIASSSDAVISPDGKVIHVQGDAREESSREVLSAAALAVDRCRTRMRRVDPEGALDLWKALVEGKWSIVDHTDTDGRRFLLARRNDAEVNDPRALSPVERQVVAYAALGHSGKLIGYELGLAPQTVADHERNALRKLRLRSRVELIRVFSEAREAREDG